MEITLTVVEKQLLAGKALAELMDGFDSFRVLYDVRNKRGLAERFRNKKDIPSIVVLGSVCGEPETVEVTAWLRKNHPGLRILAICEQEDEQVLMTLVKQGITGFLSKQTTPAELEKALWAMAKKGYYYPDWAAGKVFSSLGTETEKPAWFRINTREKEFLQYACTEMSYREIGEKMFCSPRTVESYRDSLFEKFTLRSRVGLVVYAIRNGLVKL